MRLAIVALLLLLPGSAAAAVPDPTKSHADPILVANISGADMGNAYHVNVRDVGNIPKVGVTVTINFPAGAHSRPLLEQEAGTAVSCTTTPINISRVTDGQGNVVFHARVAGADDQIRYQIRANGVLLTTIPIRSTDMDGDGDTDLSDLNAFRMQFLIDPRGAQTDYNQDGVTNLADLQLFRAEFYRGAKGSFCP